MSTDPVIRVAEAETAPHSHLGFSELLYVVDGDVKSAAWRRARAP
jgi:hypothetical protein